MAEPFAQKIALADSMKATFEAIAFVEIEEVSAETFRKNVFYTAFSRSYWSQVTLAAQDLNAQLAIYVIPDLVDVLYANAYGGCKNADKEKDEKKKDLVAEVLNVFAGVFMHTVRAGLNDFTLGLPQKAKGFKELPETATILYYLIEDIYPLVVAFSPSPNK
jgi:hypothetical protein